MEFKVPQAIRMTKTVKPKLIVPVVDVSKLIRIQGLSKKGHVKLMSKGTWATELVAVVMKYLYNFVQVDQKGSDGYFASTKELVENRCMTNGYLKFQLSIDIGGKRKCTLADLRKATSYKQWYVICDIRCYPYWKFFTLPVEFVTDRIQDKTLTPKGWHPNHVPYILEDHFELIEVETTYSKLLKDYKGMKVFYLDDGEQWWYAAETKEDAIRQHLEPLIGKVPKDFSTIADKIEFHLGCKVEDLDISEMDPAKTLKVDNDGRGVFVEKTIAEWAAQGRGLIASSVY